MLRHGILKKNIFLSLCIINMFAFESLKRKLSNLSKWDKVYLFCMGLSAAGAIIELSGIQDLNCNDEKSHRKKYVFSKSLYFINLILIAITYFYLSKINKDSYILPFFSLILISFSYAIMSMYLTK